MNNSQGVKWLYEQGLAVEAVDLSYKFADDSMGSPFRVYRSLEKMTPAQYLRSVLDIPKVSLSVEVLRAMVALGKFEAHDKRCLGIVMSGGRVYMLDDVVDNPEQFAGMVFDGVVNVENIRLKGFVCYSSGDLHGYVYELVNETGPGKPEMLGVSATETPWASVLEMMKALGVPDKEAAEAVAKWRTAKHA